MNRFYFSALLVCIASAAQAQPPCSNLSGQARMNCLNSAVQASQQRTQQIEQHNRNLDREIEAARAVNEGLKLGAGKIAPDGGSTAYSAGNALGNYIMTHPVTVNPNPQSPKPYGYQPPPMPFQACNRLPSYPNCGPATTP